VWFFGFNRLLSQVYSELWKDYNAVTFVLIKNSFMWTLAADQAFQASKATMCTTLVLALPNFTNTFDLECDASERGIGAILMQEGRPLAFVSKQLSERHLGQSIYEKQMLAIMHVVDL
jgi:hypothetical protein